MYLASDKFKKAISKKVREIKSKVIIDNLTLLDTDIVTLDIENKILSSDEFKLGGAIASNFQLVINNFDGRFNNVQFEDKEIQIFIGSTVGDNRFKLKPEIEYIPIGIYKVEKAPKQKYEITLSGFDRMVMLEKEYKSDLVYPATLLQIASEIANKAGVVLTTTNFTNSDFKVKDKPILKDITLRQAISFVAELAGGFARMNRYGELEITSINPVSDFKISRDNFYAFEKGDIAYGPIDKVEIDSFGYKAHLGQGENVLTIKDNIFAQEPSKLIQSLYNKFNGFMYTPFVSNWQGDPTMDPGDKITISDKLNIVYTSLVTHNKFIYKGGLKAETKAISKNKTVKSTQGSTIGGQIKGIKEQVVELKINDDSILARVSQTEREISGTGGLKERLQSAELKITADAIVSTVRTSIQYNNDISALQSQIIQTSEEIKAEVTNTKNNLQSQINIQAGLISQKVSSGQVYSIISSSPTAIMLGFNDINDKVTITESSFIIKDSKGNVTIQNGEIMAKKLIASDGSIGVEISGDGFIDFRKGLRSLNANIMFLDRPELGSNWDGVGYIKNLQCNTISCSNPPWATYYHTHNEFTTINNEFTNVGNQLNGIYKRLWDLEHK